MVNQATPGTRERLRRAFSRSRLARWSLAVLALLYLGAALADLLAPYAADDESREHSWASPTRVHIRDGQGWHIPFVRPIAAIV